VRLVSAGITRAIAQRCLLAVALAAVLALAAVAPSLAAIPGDPTGAVNGAVAAVPDPGTVVTGALPPAAAQPVQQAGGAARSAARPVRPAAGALQRPSQPAVEPLAPRPEPVAADPGAAVQRTTGGAGPPEAATGALPERKHLVPPAAGDGRSAEPVALDGVLRLVGDTLRTLAPVDSLTAPLGPLLAGLGLGDLAAPALAGPRSPGSRPSPGQPTAAVRPFGAGDPLGAQVRETRTGAHAALPGGLPSYQSASAQPPAAEAGGRPGSPLPRKAPAPAASGAVASAPAGSLFVPFAALLVLAALAAPKLLRRFDAAPAFLRPALFVCALERPG
jgi:hypothetical protein